MRCFGKNCGATDGINHSKECIAEHEATISLGLLDTPGNRNPDARYRGYKGEPLWAGATEDETKAWVEGQSSRL